MRPRRVIPLFVISAMLLGLIVYWSDPTGKAAFPALLEQLNLRETTSAPSPDTLARITNALVRIDADAAANAGVRLPAHEQEAK